MARTSLIWIYLCSTFIGLLQISSHWMGHSTRGMYRYWLYSIVCFKSYQWIHNSQHVQNLNCVPFDFKSPQHLYSCLEGTLSFSTEWEGSTTALKFAYQYMWLFSLNEVKYLVKLIRIINQNTHKNLRLLKDQSAKCLS